MSFDRSEIDALSLDETIELFNDFVYDTIGELNKEIKDDDIDMAYNYFQDIIKARKDIVIEQYSIYVIPEWDNIKDALNTMLKSFK